MVDCVQNVSIDTSSVGLSQINKVHQLIFKHIYYKTNTQNIKYLGNDDGDHKWHDQNRKCVEHLLRSFPLTKDIQTVNGLSM